MQATNDSTNNIIHNLNSNFMEYEIVKQLINDSRTESDLLEVRAALNKFRAMGGDNVQVCKLYQQLQNKSRKLVNSKPVTQRLFTSIHA